MKRKRKVTKIFISSENVKKLMDEFSYCKVAVYNALSYRSNSDKAKLVRKAAIEKYNGVEATEVRVVNL